jgi:hypothetical protein
MAIGEFPDEKVAATAILAAAAGGSLSDIETTVAMTAEDAHTMFEAAGKAAKGFRSAGLLVRASLSALARTLAEFGPSEAHGVIRNRLMDACGADPVVLGLVAKLSAPTKAT